VFFVLPSSKATARPDENPFGRACLACRNRKASPLSR